MGAFSYVSIAEEDQFLERYSLLKKLGKGLRNAIIPHIPDYINGTVGDIGVPGYNITGCWVCMPPTAGGLVYDEKKLSRAVSRCRNFGADVLVLDPGLECGNMMSFPGFRVSNGMFYTPFAFIDAVKSVSALMGIDFKRSNICIADASTAIGTIITELLLDEAAYLILCTDNKETLLPKVDKYILKSGLSPAIVSNYRKAALSCDILIYTGSADIVQATSYISKKVLIVNLTDESINLDKDFLSIDEVILQGQNEPLISGNNINQNVFLTSRMWEGALLILCSFDTKIYSIKNAYEMYKLSDKIGLRIKTIISNGKVLDKYSIYNYR